jgi:PAS domain S-box-containing protein
MAVTRGTPKMSELAAATNALFEGLDEAAVILELTDEATDLIVIAVNAALVARMGRPADELVGSTGGALYPPVAFADVLTKARATVEEQRVVTYEAVRELPSGRSTVAGTMIPVGGRRLVAFGRDVSEERQAIRQLEVVERSARIGSWHWNIADGDLTWSEEYRRILGLDGDVRPSSTYLMSVIHPDDRGRVQAGMDRVAGGGPPSSGIRFRVRRPDGEIRTVEGRGEVAHDADGGVVRMSGTLQDVTEQAETERRERQVADAERRQRQALEVNDDIVQGLLAAWLALQLGRADDAAQIVVRTTEAAQGLVASLLREEVVDEFLPGALVRTPVPAGAQFDT